jgi:hypothetical protein
MKCRSMSGSRGAAPRELFLFSLKGSNRPRASLGSSYATRVFALYKAEAQTRIHPYLTVMSEPPAILKRHQEVSTKPSG